MSTIFQFFTCPWRLAKKLGCLPAKGYQAGFSRLTFIDGNCYTSLSSSRLGSGSSACCRPRAALFTCLTRGVHSTVCTLLLTNRQFKRLPRVFLSRIFLSNWRVHIYIQLTCIILRNLQCFKK